MSTGYCIHTYFYKRVLIIGSDEELHNMLLREFENQGYRVRSPIAFANAVKLLETYNFALCMTMGYVDNKEIELLISQVRRSSDRNASMPFILYDRVMKVSIKKARQAGFAGTFAANHDTFDDLRALVTKVQQEQQPSNESFIHI